MKEKAEDKQIITFVSIAILIFFIVIVAIVSNEDRTVETNSKNNDTIQTSIKNTQKPKEENSIVNNANNENKVQNANILSSSTTKPSSSPTASPNSTAKTVTMGQKSALAKAKDYLDYTSFSYKGLVEQLEFEGFTNEESVYAVDNCGADWNKQAEQKAKEYINFTSFSKSGLIEQLEFEGFTRAQAEYGAKAVGY